MGVSGRTPSPGSTRSKSFLVGSRRSATCTPAKQATCSAISASIPGVSPRFQVSNRRPTSLAPDSSRRSRASAIVFTNERVSRWLR
jgi:hypothetical protein